MSIQWPLVGIWSFRVAAVLLGGWLLIQALRYHDQRDSRELEAFYAWREVAELHLQLDSTARASLSSHPREVVRAELAHKGKQYSVGVRLKGHRSMRPLDEKAAFKLDFERYEEGQTFLGTRRLTLNNLVEDPTMMREALAYHFLNALGVASPRTGYARLFVNGEAYGVYLMLETVDKRFVARRWGAAPGLIYEGEYGCDLFPEDVPGFDHDVGEDPGRAQLRSLATAAAGEAGPLFDAGGPLNMPKFLRYLAASAVLGDFDGYRHSHNYRIYYDSTERKWQFLPWGLDRVFQQRLGLFDSEGWLAQRCFADAACRLEYVKALAVVAEELEATPLLERASEIWALIGRHAAADPRKPYAAARMATERAELVSFIRERPAQVREQLSCIDSAGRELDRDGDGQGCMDCDDTNAAVGPHAAERCDGVDNDCSGITDDAPACPCSEVVIAERVYHLCNWAVQWTDARALCEAKGLSLAHVDAKGVSRALYKAARRLDRGRWWIGYSDSKEEGNFRSSSGAPLEFTYWDKGQPNNRGCNEDCVALRDGRGGRWQDAPCHQHHPFICSVNTPAQRQSSRVWIDPEPPSRTLSDGYKGRQAAD